MLRGAFNTGAIIAYNPSSLEHGGYRTGAACDGLVEQIVLIVTGLNMLATSPT